MGAWFEYLVFGVMFGAPAVVIAFELLALRKMRLWHPTDAVVCHRDERAASKEGPRPTSWYLMYETPDAIQVRPYGSPPSDAGPDPYMVGRVVRIAFNPKKPWRFVIVRERSEVFLTIAFFAGFMAFVALGFSQRREWL